MISLLLMISLFMLLSIILMFINIIISKKLHIDREKSTPYECGFDPMNSTKESFSIQFFIIGIMFLTFDIEIVMLIPMVYAMKIKMIYWLISSVVIIIILFMGLIIEWMENSIKWEK